MNEIKYFYQRRTRGFDERELWSLDISIAKFILPRLIEFRKSAEEFGGVPADYVEDSGNEVRLDLWLSEIDKMIVAFELIIEDDMMYNKDDSEKVEIGLDSFRKYFFNLWT